MPISTARNGGRPVISFSLNRNVPAAGRCESDRGSIRVVFPIAVPAQQRQHLSLRHRERHPLKDVAVPVVRVDVLDGEHHAPPDRSPHQRAGLHLVPAPVATTQPLWSTVTRSVKANATSMSCSMTMSVIRYSIA